MPTERRGVGSEIPESDLVDRSTPMDPIDPDQPFEDSQVVPALVNETDWVDQQIPVPIDDSEREEL